MSTSAEDRALDEDRLSLRADCASGFALFCVAPAFSASADFAITKKAGQACPHLHPDFRCGIHTELRQQGFRGCTVYDCFGAGQKVSGHFRRTGLAAGSANRRADVRGVPDHAGPP